MLARNELAMYFRTKTSGGRAYLQIVESRREGAQVRQQVIATLGRVEDLRESGQLERLLRSGARFAAKAIVVDALNDGTAISAEVRRIGPLSCSNGCGTRPGAGPSSSSSRASASMGFLWNAPSSSPCCIACSLADRTGPLIGGVRITGLLVSRGSNCIISIGRWLGSARSCRQPNRLGALHSHRAVSRTLSKNACSPDAA